MLKKIFLYTLSLYFCLFPLAANSDADGSAVDALSGKVDELYFNEELARGKWQRVAAVEYKNRETGVKERDTIYRASRRVVMVHELFDGENQESRTFVTRYATTDFAGLLQGLAPGTPADAVDRLLGAPYVTQGSARGYRNESGNVWVAVSFRSGRAYLLDVHAPPEGGGQDQTALGKISAQFETLGRRL
jgi:hypothetical protein